MGPGYRRLLEFAQIGVQFICLFFFVERLLGQGMRGPEGAGYGFSKARVGCKPCFEGQGRRRSLLLGQKSSCFP
jgi:hypothetical protein